MALARLGRVNRIGRKNTVAVNQGLVIGRLVLGANIAPIAARMAVEAGVQVVRVASLQCARCCHDLPKREFGRVGDAILCGSLRHGLAFLFGFKVQRCTALHLCPSARLGKQTESLLRGEPTKQGRLRLGETASVFLGGRGLECAGAKALSPCERGRHRMAETAPWLAWGVPRGGASSTRPPPSCGGFAQGCLLSCVLAVGKEGRIACGGLLSALEPVCFMVNMGHGNRKLSHSVQVPRRAG
jgi:hypothetical protein